ncbi:unnamed protein product, partial [Bubo scandiacus]
ATVCHKTCSKSRAGVWICQLGGRGWEPLLLEKTFERKKKNHVVIKQDKKPCQRNVDLASFQRVNVVIREGRKDSEGKDIVLHWAPARKPRIEEEVCGWDSMPQNVNASSGLSHGNQ